MRSSARRCVIYLHDYIEALSENSQLEHLFCDNDSKMKTNSKDSMRSEGNLIDLGILCGDYHCSLLGTDDPSCQVSNEDTAT